MSEEADARYANLPPIRALAEMWADVVSTPLRGFHHIYEGCKPGEDPADGTLSWWPTDVWSGRKDPEWILTVRQGLFTYTVWTYKAPLPPSPNPRRWIGDPGATYFRRSAVRSLVVKTIQDFHSERLQEQLRTLQQRAEVS